MEMLQADYLLCLDSDGQCDPRDFWQFWESRNTADIVLGWRVDRADTVLRRTFSRFFYVLYQAAFRTPVHDPSCPFVLMGKPVASTIVKELGSMQQGFWWEFVARVHRRHFSIRELPVHHRLRTAGVTQVYRWQKMPGIFCRHVMAIFQIWMQTRS
jgi:glycosyltransferase involved in cell wall biosynthesis